MWNENLKGLSPNQYWLLQHQITAFWHGFGISNGLSIKEEDLERSTWPNGEPDIRIKTIKMRELLQEYLKWLKQYNESWEETEPHPWGIDDFDKFLANESVHESRIPILEMINLLQATNRKGEKDV